MRVGPPPSADAAPDLVRSNLTSDWSKLDHNFWVVAQLYGSAAQSMLDRPLVLTASAQVDRSQAWRSRVLCHAYQKCSLRRRSSISLDSRIASLDWQI